MFININIYYTLHIYQCVNISLRYWQGVGFLIGDSMERTIALLSQTVDKIQFLTVVGVRSHYLAGSQLRPLNWLLEAI